MLFFDVGVLIVKVTPHKNVLNFIFKVIHFHIVDGNRYEDIKEEMIK